MRAVAAVLVAVAGCAAAQSVTSKAAPPALGREAAAQAPAATARRGLPHLNAIDLVALSRDGTAALSRDRLGELRLWAALDGSQEPLAIAINNPSSFSVERRGAGFSIAVVDDTEALHILGADANGTVIPWASLPPSADLAVAQAEVVPGGEVVAVLAKDHSVRLLSLGGDELGRYEGRDFEPTVLRVSADGHSLVAAALAYEKQTTELSWVALTIRDKSLVKPSRPHEITIEGLSEGKSIQLNPSGKLLGVGYVAGRNMFLSAISSTAPSGRKDLALGEQTAGLTGLGFDNDTVVRVISGNAVGLRVNVVSGAQEHFANPTSLLSLQGTTLAHGVIAAGFGSSLRVTDFKTQATLYLGYEHLGTVAAAVDKTGDHVAVLRHPYDVVIIDVATGASHAVGLERRGIYGSVSFIDSEHLLLGDSLGDSFILHWPSNTVLHQASIGYTSSSELSPDGRWLRLLIPGGGVAIVPVSVKKGFGKLAFIPDGSNQGTVAAGPAGELAVVTAKSSLETVRYSLRDILAGVAHDVIDKGVTKRTGRALTVLAMDATGASYHVDVNVVGGRRVPTLVRLRGDERREIVLSNLGGDKIYPSPDGRRVALQHDSDLMVYDTASGEELWHRSVLSHTQMRWSDDGTRLLHVGVVLFLFDGATGKTVLSRCALEFRAAATTSPSPADLGVACPCTAP